MDGKRRIRNFIKRGGIKMLTNEQWANRIYESFIERLEKEF